VSHLPYRPEHVSDAIANSVELTNEELGAFMRLTWALWRAGGYLPNDSKKLARFARAGSRWGLIAQVVMSKFTVSDDKISCPYVLYALSTVERRRHNLDGDRNRKAVVPLNSSKPLKSLEPHITVGTTNQNQNHEDKDSGVRDIYAFGVWLLQQRVKQRALAARSQIAKWLQAVGDEAELGKILRAVLAENLNGAQLVAVVGQRVRSIKSIKDKGAVLPFGPMIASDKGSS
jgi:hypothetical protein